MVSYTSFSFFLLYFGITAVIYSIMPQKVRWIVLLCGSYFFYFVSSKGNVIPLILVSLAVWGCGLWLEKMQSKMKGKRKASSDKEEKKKIRAQYNQYKRRILTFAVLLVVLILLICKYTGFFVETVNGIFKSNIANPGIIQPLGISFFVLEGISYMADVYYGKIEAEKNPLKISLYLSFMLTVVEGPVARYDQLGTQLSKCKYNNLEDISKGYIRMVWGLFKKIVIADRAVILVSAVFDNYERYSGLQIAAGIAFYTLQLYCEFSGVMDIVCGLGSFLGIKLPENFNQPFFAKSINEFWQRWHITLGAFLRDYIFYPVSLSKGIKNLSAKTKEKFNQYWEGLKANLNPSVSQSDAVEMLAQHMITKPVFEALFGNDHFTKENPVSKSLEEIVKLLDEKSDSDDMEKLERFYKSVQKRAEGIDNAEAKQKIVVELYDSFFRNAFPMTVKKLGIVYTPVPIVDFIIKSAEFVLNTEFGRSISDENVRIIDPFTGTGTFITRLLQSGIIRKEDLERKYKHEIFANEIVLLAYYIASVNIENVYHDLIQKTPKQVRDNSHAELVSAPTYEPFNGICLTDTFQLYETKDINNLQDKVFQENSERVNEQKKLPITVIMGNPPYSIGQESANDNAQNQKYPLLESQIEKTYARLSNATSVKAVYDSYIKAFRWASDRLDKNNGGVIAFITNSGYLDKNGFDGFRKTLQTEFDSVYVFNLRGAIRGKSGEGAKKEGQNVFDIMTGVAITILVKQKARTGNCKIHYCDIGNYLSRGDKFKKITEAKSIQNLECTEITPNEYGDWITARNDLFATWIPVDCTKKYDVENQSFFLTYSLGIATGRDMWAYSFSSKNLLSNIEFMAKNYNEEVERYKSLTLSAKELDSWVNSDSSKIAWNRNLKEKLQKKSKIFTNDDGVTISSYRPFCKQNFYFHNDFNAMQYQQKRLFPTPSTKNLVILITGLQERKGFATLISDCIPDLNNFDGGTQCFPLYWYEDVGAKDTLFASAGLEESQYVRHDAISDFILKRAQDKYGNKVIKEDLFYYVYGILHSKSYREKFADDLKKMLPRIPLVGDYKKFFAFVEAGRKLAKLHLNYENLEPCKEVKVESLEQGQYKIPKTKYDLDDGSLVAADSATDFALAKSNPCDNSKDYEYYAVNQMEFERKGEKDTIIYNHYHKVTNIPLKAYDYEVNGQSAIEHVMEWYGSKKWNAQAKKSGSSIVNNPNAWSREHQKPRYILDLLLSVINVSVQTVDIVNGLPDVDWEKE